MKSPFSTTDIALASIPKFIEHERKEIAALDAEIAKLTKRRDHRVEAIGRYKAELEAAREAAAKDERK